MGLKIQSQNKNWINGIQFTFVVPRRHNRCVYIADIQVTFNVQQHNVLVQCWHHATDQYMAQCTMLIRCCTMYGRLHNADITTDQCMAHCTLLTSYYWPMHGTLYTAHIILLTNAWHTVHCPHHTADQRMAHCILLTSYCSSTHGTLLLMASGMLDKGKISVDIQNINKGTPYTRLKTVTTAHFHVNTKTH
jgi:hypothetical protein